MVFPKEEKLVHSLRLSSVGPSRVTGSDVVEGPTPMDLAMKLHYLRGVYYFSSQATQGLTISGIKKAMFEWLNVYYKACGRFKRWPETGRPYIKCNDCGVRIIEAKCEKTIDEWLDLLGEDCGLRKLLVYDQAIGPELSFCPLVLIQRDNGLGDVIVYGANLTFVIVYGANLTFVDLGDAVLYGLELKGLEPVFADFTIESIGSEGLVIVAPGPRLADEMGREGRVVTVIVAEDQMPKLKDKLKRKSLVLDKSLN